MFFNDRWPYPRERLTLSQSLLNFGLTVICQESRTPEVPAHHCMYVRSTYDINLFFGHNPPHGKIAQGLPTLVRRLGLFVLNLHSSTSVTPPLGR